MATPVQLGVGNIWTIGNASITIYQPGGLAAIAGYGSPNIQSVRFSHSGGAKARVTGQEGQVVSKMFAFDDMAQMTIDFIPQGATIADAVKSAFLPVEGSLVVIAGFPIIQVGRFLDVFNGPVNGAPVWIYEGDGQINPANNGAWSASLPLEKCLYITSGVPVG